MARFQIYGRLRLLAPPAADVRRVKQRLQSQLRGVSIPVNVHGSRTAVAQLNRVAAATKKVTAGKKAATAASQSFAHSVVLATRRYAAFIVGTSGALAALNMFSNSLREAIELQREGARVAQLMGKSISHVSELMDTAALMARRYGVSQREFLEMATILKTGGMELEKINRLLGGTAGLATLAPTIENTKDLSNAILTLSASYGQSSMEIKSSLESIIGLSGKYAVEADDLVQVLSRLGGMYNALGTDMHELLGLFTAIRHATRMPSTQIMTTLRMVGTKLGDPKIREMLRGYGLTPERGGVVTPPFEMFRQLGEMSRRGGGAGRAQVRDILATVAKIRHTARLIPLMENWHIVEESVAESMKSRNIIMRQALIYGETYAGQLAKLKGELQSVTRELLESRGFKAFTKGLFDASRSVLDLMRNLGDLMPILGMTGLGLAGAGVAKGVGKLPMGLAAAALMGPRGAGWGGARAAAGRHLWGRYGGKVGMGAGAGAIGLSMMGSPAARAGGIALGGAAAGLGIGGPWGALIGGIGGLVGAIRVYTNEVLVQAGRLAGKEAAKLREAAGVRGFAKPEETVRVLDILGKAREDLIEARKRSVGLLQRGREQASLIGMLPLHGTGRVKKLNEIYEGLLAENAGYLKEQADIIWAGSKNRKEFEESLDGKGKELLLVLGRYNEAHIEDYTQQKKRNQLKEQADAELLESQNELQKEYKAEAKLRQQYLGALAGQIKGFFNAINALAEARVAHTTARGAARAFRDKRAGKFGALDTNKLIMDEVRAMTGGTTDIGRITRVGVRYQQGYAKTGFEGFRHIADQATRALQRLGDSSARLVGINEALAAVERSRLGKIGYAEQFYGAAGAVERTKLERQRKLAISVLKRGHLAGMSERERQRAIEALRLPFVDEERRAKVLEETMRRDPRFRGWIAPERRRKGELEEDKARILRESAQALGGIVEIQSQVYKNHADSMHEVAKEIIEGTANMKSIIEAIKDPIKWTMQAVHKVEVSINGAEVFRTMDNKFKQMVQEMIILSTNSMLRQKFPDVGDWRPTEGDRF